MRYFNDTHGATLQAPDHIVLDDFPQLTEIGWSYYLEKVRMKLPFDHENDPNEPLFLHRKYHDKGAWPEDLIGENFHAGSGELRNCLFCDKGFRGRKGKIYCSSFCRDGMRRRKW